MVVALGFEPRYSKRADLQSAGFNHSPKRPNIKMADGVGFEPTVPKRYSSFQD
jgi:hypothetical protein